MTNSTGSKPGRLYGLPKVHKDGVPLRPIVSCIDSYTYNLAKYLVRILQPICDSEFSLKDSFTFGSEMRHITQAPFMVSFDVVSLFTNIPIDETIDLCLDKLFHDSDLVNGLSRRQLKHLLTVAAKENHFLFGDKLFDQCDGVAMGSPLGPILANIFMTHLETKALQIYDATPPMFYHCYMDDTFINF